MKYVFEVVETRYVTVEVEAENSREAQYKAEMAYFNDEISLDTNATILDGTEFEDTTDYYNNVVKNYTPTYSI